MLKVLGVIFLLFVVVVGGLLAYAATRPDTLRVTRSASIKAPPEKIFPLINDFHNWPSWSPYENKDANMKRTMSGSASGKGAVYEWDGNNDIGSGRMEITDSTPSSKVAIDLHFIRPFEGNNTVNFTLEPQADATTVTWDMQGRQPFMAKVMGIFINMDKMIGTDFDAGLANMKNAAEK